jgi:two-component system response regulator (stage 0 sporulation protein F)
LKNKLILVVDDQAGIRVLLAEALGAVGHTVQTAASGRQALECMRRQRPDLVLLDVNMPGMSGADTLRELRRSYREVPVMLITADEQDLATDWTDELSVTGWLCKPFELDDLYQQVAAALDS